MKLAIFSDAFYLILILSQFNLKKQHHEMPGEGNYCSNILTTLLYGCTIINVPQFTYNNAWILLWVPGLLVPIS